MTRYQLSYPPRVVFGAGTFVELPALLPASGALLIVCGGHARARADELAAACPERRSAIVDGIAPELPLAEVERIRAAGREIAAQVVVGLGGGSAIDAAKSAAALLELPGPVEDYFYGRRELRPRQNFFAAVPTTAGTGAEITPNAVLTDPAARRKQSIRHESMTPDLALVDPALTYGSPAAVTAAAGFDALTQAIESAISNRANAISRPLAIAAFLQLFAALPDACRDDHAARRLVAEGSMMTGLAFAQSGLGAVHGIGHPVGSLLGLPHGVTCAILLPAVLRFNAAAVEQVAPQLNFASAAALVTAVEALRRQLALPENFRAAGLGAEHYPFILEHCRSGSMKSNPVPMRDADVVALLEELS